MKTPAIMDGVRHTVVELVRQHGPDHKFELWVSDKTMSSIIRAMRAATSFEFGTVPGQNVVLFGMVVKEAHVPAPLLVRMGPSGPEVRFAPLTCGCTKCGAWWDPSHEDGSVVVCYHCTSRSIGWATLDWWETVETETRAKAIAESAKARLSRGAP